jgi:LacI family transcriptional regulator
MIKRESLVTKVVDVLKRELPWYAGKQWLPGERRLKDQLNVGRTTIRAALARMQKERLVRAYPQRGYRILLPRGYRRSVPRLVCYLQESRIGALNVPHLLMLGDIEHGLAGAGYELKTFVTPSARRHDGSEWLAGLISEHQAACWLLTTTSLKTQQWFVKHDVPALILGSCYPGINLPSMDIDYTAVGRYAAGVFWRQGHRRICILTHTPRFGGDICAEEGFQAILCQLGGGALSAGIFQHDGSAEDVQRVLAIRFARARPPTAMLVTKSLNALTAVSYLIYKGFRVPQDVSVICRDDGMFLEHVIPSIAYYAVDRQMYARRCVRAMIQLITAGFLKPGRRLVEAQFVRGATIAPPPA